MPISLYRLGWAGEEELPRGGARPEDDGAGAGSSDPVLRVAEGG